MCARHPQPADGTAEGQRGLLRADDNLGFDADDGLDLADEFGAVRGIARRRRRNEAGARRTKFLDHPLVFDGGFHGPQNRARVQVAARVHPLTQAHDTHLARQVGEAGATVLADGRVGDEQSD